MKYNVILRIPTEKEGSYNQEKIVKFVESLGWNLLSVQGSYNKFWFTSKTVDGKRVGLMSGGRYYKLVVNDRDFGIECGGDYNGWSFAGEIRQNIKDGRAKEAA